MQFGRAAVAVVAFLGLSAPLQAAVDLGTMGNFAILAGSTITNTGSSVVTGDVGLSPGTAITGFVPVTLTGTVYAADAVALQAQVDWTTAYGQATATGCTADLSGQDLGGLTLIAGTYCFASSAQLTGVLTLDAQNDPNAQFLFKIGSALTTASASSVVWTNGGGLDNQLFWQVGSSATLGTTTAFTGNILALTSITLNTGASIQCGRALASTGAVTLDSNTVSIGGCAQTAVDGVPEPSTWAMLLAGFGLLGIQLRRRAALGRCRNVTIA